MSLPAEAHGMLYPVLAILGATVVAVGAIAGGLVRGFTWLSEEMDKKQKAREGSVEFRKVIREESIEALRTDDGQATIASGTRRALDAEKIVSRVDEALRAATACHRRLDDHLEQTHAGAKV